MGMRSKSQMKDETLNSIENYENDKSVQAHSPTQQNEIRQEDPSLTRELPTEEMTIIQRVDTTLKLNSSSPTYSPNKEERYEMNEECDYRDESHLINNNNMVAQLPIFKLANFDVLKKSTISSLLSSQRNDSNSDLIDTFNTSAQNKSSFIPNEKNRYPITERDLKSATQEFYQNVKKQKPHELQAPSSYHFEMDQLKLSRVRKRKSKHMIFQQILSQNRKNRLPNFKAQVSGQNSKDRVINYQSQLSSVFKDY